MDPTVELLQALAPAANPRRISGPSDEALRPGHCQFPKLSAADTGSRLASRYAHTGKPALITFLLLTAWQTGIAPVPALRLTVPIFGVDWPLAPSLAAVPRWGPTPLQPCWSVVPYVPEHGGWRNCDHPHRPDAPDGRWVPAGTPLRFWIELGFKALKPPGLPPAEDPPQQRREAESYVHPRLAGTRAVVAVGRATPCWPWR